MKIFSAAKLKQADRFTIENEPISSLHLMERAGERLFSAILAQFPDANSFVCVCGAGNNGGDGLVLARLFALANKKVEVFILKGNYTAEFSTNFHKIKDLSIPYTEITEPIQINNITFDKETVIIDALFGVGISRPLAEIAAHFIQKLNSFPNLKIAIDMPSGLSPDCNYLSTFENTLKADITFTIQFPKKSFFFAENEEFVGDFECVDIGISKDFIESNANQGIYLQQTDIEKHIQARAKFGHKGTYGHVLILAGSEGKIGAAILSAKAALKSGCGLLSVCIPAQGSTAVHAAFPEAMLIPQEKFVETIDLSIYKAIGFGPGIGTSAEAKEMLIFLLRNYKGKIVIDADGLNMLSQDKKLLDLLGKNCILTPHPGEFDRLTQNHSTGFERYKSQLAFSEKYQVILVLKGHHTSITTPEGISYFNSTGNNGMATAGSGDVLTGIITALCAQGYSCENAAIIGVYLHGFAGDCAADKYSKTSMIASDIIENIGFFFQGVEK